MQPFCCLCLSLSVFDCVGTLPDTVRTTKKSSTPVASDTTTEKSAADKNKTTTNRNLSQGKGSDIERTVTSYFDPVWNAFSNHTDGSMEWIPKQIVAIGEDFHRQVGDGKVRTTLYKVRWEGYDKKDDTWKPITHVQTGKQHDALKKRTMDKTLEITLKSSINTTLPTCDDKRSCL